MYKIAGKMRKIRNTVFVRRIRKSCLYKAMCCMDEILKTMMAEKTMIPGAIISSMKLFIWKKIRFKESNSCTTGFVAVLS